MLKVKVLLFAFFGCLSAQAAEVTIRIETDNSGPVISRYIYGHFLEHLGRAVYDGVCDPMCSTR